MYYDVKTPMSEFIRYGPLFGSILRCLQLHRNLQFEADRLAYAHTFNNVRV